MQPSCSTADQLKFGTTSTLANVLKAAVSGRALQCTTLCTPATQQHGTHLSYKCTPQPAHMPPTQLGSAGANITRFFN
jgi:hypothetical protein